MTFFRGARILAQLVLGATVWFGIHSTISATTVPNGTYSFDAIFSDSGLMSFDGTRFTTPADPNVPVDNLNVELEDGSGTLLQGYPDATFQIDSGFQVESTIIVDTNNNDVGPGDAISSQIGPGTFTFKDGGGQDIFLGSFNSATFASDYGGNSGGIIASSGGGLDLMPGPGFAFDDTAASQIFNPEGLSLVLTGINNTGITTSQELRLHLPGGTATNVFSASLDPFSLSQGTVMHSGSVVVVPEPSTLLLFLVGLLACGFAGPAQLPSRRSAASVFTWLALSPVIAWSHLIPMTTRRRPLLLLFVVAILSFVLPALAEQPSPNDLPAAASEFKLPSTSLKQATGTTANDDTLSQDPLLDLIFTDDDSNVDDTDNVDPGKTARHHATPAHLADMTQASLSLMQRLLLSPTDHVPNSVSSPWELAPSGDGEAAPSLLSDCGLVDVRALEILGGQHMLREHDGSMTTTSLNKSGQIEIRQARLIDRNSVITDWIEGLYVR